MLEITWFILWGVLWAVYFMLDGFDFGVGMLIPFLSKSETDKSIMYKTIGPLWDGNEVWLIAAGGITFAAFPSSYAVMFSALYTPLMLILFALIFRGIVFEFRSKIEHPKWNTICDYAMLAGSFLPALLFGVAFANLYSGIPLIEKGILDGNLFSLLKPYALLGGILFVLLFLQHGLLWIAVKSTGDLNQKAVSLINSIWPIVTLVIFVFFAINKFATPLYNNYIDNKVLIIIPFISVLGIVSIRYFTHKNNYWYSWYASCIGIFFLVLYGIIGMFPNILLSSIDEMFSMTVYNSASSPLTLRIMLGVVIFFIPIIIAYQTWVYWLFKDKINPEDVSSY